MAAAATKSFVYLGGAIANNVNNGDIQFDFDESDIWNVVVESEDNPHVINQQLGNSKISSQKSSLLMKSLDDRRSLPVKIPDWSRIMMDEDEDEDEDEDVHEEEDDYGGGILPPHEYLARRKKSFSFSVHEGFGRTLKGRDMRRVRNAVWKHTAGFED